MSSGIETTLRFLKETPNGAAIRVLIPALDSPRPEVRQAALETLLERRNLAGHKAIIGRLHTMDENQQQLVMRNSTRISAALRFAILATDRQVCENGCGSAVRFREYDLIPALISAVEDKANPNADLVGKTLCELARCLSEELGDGIEVVHPRDPRTVLKYVMPSVGNSVDRFAFHGRRETIASFTLLAQRDDATLGQILMAPRHPAFLVLMEILSGSQDKAILELILSFLDHPQAPSAILSVAAKRSDLGFIRCLLERIGHEPPPVLTENLKRMGAVAWLAAESNPIDRFSGDEQGSAIRLAMLSGTPRENTFGLIRATLLHGRSAGRLAASEALAEFDGAEANTLSVEVLKDPDPRVQANAVRQIRRRGIPGTLPLLVGMVDSPHEEVRRAARENLTEFNFERFLDAFDILDDEVRHSTGELVKKIDPLVVPSLIAELTCQARTRRIRGLEMARALNVVGELEGTIVGLLMDEDHIVRADAASTLGESRMSSRIASALTEALQDSSESVRQAARASLRNHLVSAED